MLGVTTTPSGDRSCTLLQTFRQSLASHGYVEGRDVIIETRWAGGRIDQLPALAAEMVGLRVDIIVGVGAVVARAAKSVTTTIGSPRMAPASAPPDIDAPGAQWYKVDGSNGRKFLTAILRPQGTGPFPVVVVLHSAAGLTNSHLSLAEDLARAGFLVVIGCWHAGNRPTPGNAACSEAIPQAEWVADPAANSGKELIAIAKTLPNAKADRVGLYGISCGGYAALWAASTGAGVQAVVADAPAHRPAITPAPASSQDVVARLDAQLLILHGPADKAIPVEQSREYERAARALGKSIAVVYLEGVGHEPSSLLPESQIEARQRAIAFLREKL